eukprot:GEMP01013092.1.p1 GENE.GEMP01013092.1~~GEMP01013092.1.p1  ORF type:complete len:535 (+),score=106.76 GEMP01013092.1:261-1865(+)
MIMFTWLIFSSLSSVRARDSDVARHGLSPHHEVPLHVHDLQQQPRDISQPQLHSRAAPPVQAIHHSRVTPPVQATHYPAAIALTLICAACIVSVLLYIHQLSYNRHGARQRTKRARSAARGRSMQYNAGPWSWWNDEECTQFFAELADEGKVGLPTLPRAIPCWSDGRITRLLEDHNIQLTSAEFADLRRMVNSGEVFAVKKTTSLPGVLLETRSIVLRICNPSDNLHLLMGTKFPECLWPRGQDVVDVCSRFVDETFGLKKKTLRYQVRGVIQGNASCLGIIPIRHHHQIVDAVLSGLDEDLTWTLPWTGECRWVSEDDSPEQFPADPLLLLLKEPFGKRYLTFEHETVWVHRSYLESKEEAVKQFLSQILGITITDVKMSISNNVVEAVLISADDSPAWDPLGLPTGGSFRTSAGDWYWEVNLPAIASDKRHFRSIESVDFPEWSPEDIAPFLRVGMNDSVDLEAISISLNEKTSYLLGDTRLSVLIFPIAIVMIEAERPEELPAFLVDTTGKPTLPQAPMKQEGIEADHRE